MFDEKLLFSLKQAFEYDDYGYDAPLDRVEFIVQNGHAALRLVLNETGFKKEITTWEKEASLREVYGKKESNHEDALKNFSDLYTDGFTKNGIKNFRESDSQIVVYLPDKKTEAIKVLEKLKEFSYYGNVKSYDSYHGDYSPHRTRIPLITKYEELSELLNDHFYKTKAKPEASLCDKIRIINDGNAIVGVSKFTELNTPDPAVADVSTHAILVLQKQSRLPIV